MRPRNRLKAVGNSLEGESGGFSISLEASLQRRTRKRKALISEESAVQSGAFSPCIRPLFSPRWCVASPILPSHSSLVQRAR